MIVTKDNLNEIGLEKKESDLLESLLSDLSELNDLIGWKFKLCIDRQDFHNEWSPERTDPCPDYYGMYWLRREDNPSEPIVGEMDIHDLDDTLCALINFTKAFVSQ